jgi:uncharacterized protein (DUF362 family)
MKKSDGRFSRRQFLKGSLSYLAAHGLILPVCSASAAASKQGGVPLLSMAKGNDPFGNTILAVELLGGMSAFVTKGARVLIKPNIAWDRRIEQAATTNPAVVHALSEMCLDAGASKVLILDRTCNDARRCYRTSGMIDMVNKISSPAVSLEYVKENRFRKTHIPRGVVVRQWPLYEEALKADVIINVPIAKHHSISGLTLGMKNLMGLMGGNRGMFHSGIGQKLADLTSVITPDLTVMDATRILVRNGPTGGRMEDVRVLNRVAASADPVAIDAYGATLFDMAPGDLPSVVAGFKMGLGEMDLAKMRIVEG